MNDNHFSSRTEITGRLDRLKKAMAEAGTDYLIIPSSDYHQSEYVSSAFRYREYYSGFDGSNGTLVVSKEETLLWTDGRYFIQADRQLKGTGIVLMRMLEKDVPTIEEYLESRAFEGCTVGVDGRCISTACGKKLEERLSKKKAKLDYSCLIAEKCWPDRPELPGKPIIYLEESLTGESTDKKLGRLREWLADKIGADAVFISRLDEIMWLFNLRGRDIEHTPVAISYAFVTMHEAYFFAAERSMSPELKAVLLASDIVWIPYEKVFEFIKDYLKNSFEGTIVCDEHASSFYVSRFLSALTECRMAESPLEMFKAVKNRTELRHIKEVYLKDSAALTRFIFKIKNSADIEMLDEYQAGQLLDEIRLSDRECYDLSFDTISAYGPNAAMAHYRAEEETASKLKKNGFLLVDSGGQYVGGTTDVTRTIVLGSLTGDMKRHFTRVLQGMLRLADTVFLHGCTGRNLDVIAREELWREAVDYKHGTGHGIGYMLSVHEGPQNIRWKYTQEFKEAVIEPGMLISDEPGVYIEGKYGIRTENIILAEEFTENADGSFLKFSHLTYVPIDLEAVDTELLTERDIRLLNNYHSEVYEKLEPFMDDEEKQWLKKACRHI